MQMILVLLAALLPFLHEQVYEAEVTGCDASGITLTSQGTTFESELFNVDYLEEDGWKKTCDLLEDAQQVTFEVDDAVDMQEPLPVYLYADGKMIQVSLLEQKKAYIEIRNPRYRHEDTLEMAQSDQSVMAKSAQPFTHGSLPLRSYLAYGIIVLIWIFMFYHLIYRHWPKVKNK